MERRGIMVVMTLYSSADAVTSTVTADTLSDSIVMGTLQSVLI